ncbi:Uncharacterized protein Fot_10692 [Forsythia ovata]|uniref:Uncharacterized protein n=1 Tax=Forsythia ovata TaxID=205694 RepID=A0ABD1WHJ6_9LAMI
MKAISYIFMFILIHELMLMHTDNAVFSVEAARLQTAFQWELKEVFSADLPCNLAVTGKRRRLAASRTPEPTSTPTNNCPFSSSLNSAASTFVPPAQPYSIPSAPPPSI